MEQFKEKLKVENRITAVFCVIFALFILFVIAAEAGFVELTPVAGDSHWQSTWRGMLSGAASGILGLMLFSLIRTNRALKDEQKLKKMYIEANDERMIQIWTAARASSTQATLLIGLVAGMIAGYFSMTVSITILALEFFLALTGGAFKLYYTRKY